MLTILQGTVRMQATKQLNHLFNFKLEIQFLFKWSQSSVYQTVLVPFSSLATSHPKLTVTVFKYLWLFYENVKDEK